MIERQTQQNRKTTATINCNGRLVDISQPIVMGILNVTPDSFYDGGQHDDKQQIVQHADRLLNEGATIIDIGAYSSRPAAQHIDKQQEWQRLEKALQAVRKAFPQAILSVDTFRAELAENAVKHFAVDMINDISAGTLDASMFGTVARLNVPYCMMHIKGTPQTMQIRPEYENLFNEIFKYFAVKVEKLREFGVNDIIIDPGFGFGKTIEHNYELLRRLDEFKLLDLPVLVGLSRKSMIFKLLNTSPQQALNGTTVLNTIALLKGANIIRVHDVKPAMEIVQLLKIYKPRI